MTITHVNSQTDTWFQAEMTAIGSVHAKWTNWQEGNADPALNPGFYIFLLIFQHKWMFLSTMEMLPFEGHNVAY